VTTAPLYDESGEVMSVVHVAKDVTVHKQMENTLRESEQAIRKSFSQITQIFQSVGDGVCVIDVGGSILQINKVFAAMLGAAGTGEEIGKKHTEVLPSSIIEAYHDAIKEFEKGVGRVETDVLLERQDGINIPCIMTATPFYDIKDHMVGVIVSLKDITERKTAEKVLLESVKLKSNFMSMVSHELRTPLTAIKEGISIVLDGSAGEINEEQRDFLDTAYRNVDRLTRVVNDVLDLSKLKAGKMLLKIEESDMVQAVLEVVKANEALAFSKGLYVKSDVDPGTPHARFDRDRIAQVLNNLVSNALKFTESGGVTISVKGKEDGIFVSVSDTGCGIKPDDIQKLFTEFRQLEDAKTRKTGGTGLGLAICRQIVERHGGRIWAESEYGIGSSFNFVIPFERTVKVLVVDDDMYFQELAGRLLHGKGYTVLRAVTGLEGVEVAAKNKPDIIILDMRLPDMNGYEVVGRIRSEEELSETPILAVSGYEEEFKKLEKVQGRALERLSKPFDNEEFLSKVRSLEKTGR
jgi:PAS domain S-box-containing protein